MISLYCTFLRKLEHYGRALEACFSFYYLFSSIKCRIYFTFILEEKFTEQKSGRIFQVDFLKYIGRRRSSCVQKYLGCILFKRNGYRQKKKITRKNLTLCKMQFLPLLPSSPTNSYLGTFHNKMTTTTLK